MSSIVFKADYTMNKKLRVELKQPEVSWRLEQHIQFLSAGSFWRDHFTLQRN